jgi:hypothetical protein
MIATYVAALVICAASLLVGRALLSLAGRRRWSWLEPAVGFGALLSVAGVLARLPGHGRTATIGVILLGVAALVQVVRDRRGYDMGGTLGIGAAVVVVVALVLSFPFAVEGHWGLLGVGFNNDLGLHLAWAEWLRVGFGPTPDAGYPLGPHGIAVAVAALPGIELGEAFIGEIFAIGILTGLTALGALPGISATRRVLGAALVAIPYLAASYFAQAAFKETAEALLVLAFAIYLTAPEAPPRGSAAAQLRWALPLIAIAGGIFFAYSFAGIAWPVAIAVLWALAQAPVRRFLRPGRVLRFLLRPSTLIGILVIAGLGVALTIGGSFGFGGGFSNVAGSNTYGPVSPIEALGIWPAANYRLAAAGGADLPGLAGAIAVLALLAGVAWWVQRREATIPLALGAGALLYLVSLPFTGDYSQAKALMIIAPLATLVIIRPLLSEFPGPGRSRRRRDENPSMSAGIGPSTPGSGGVWRVGWAALAIVFIGGAVYSSFLALRDAPVAPPGHGAQLEAFQGLLHGQKVLFAGQDRYAAYELLGAESHVPLVDFPDPGVSPNAEKPFDTGDAYSPIDFDSFGPGVLNRFPYVITGRGAWNSQAPPDFKRIAATPDYVLWERTGPAPEDRHVLTEGTEAGAYADCRSPEVRVLLSSGGRAAVFPAVAIGGKSKWDPGSVFGNGEETAQTLNLTPGKWNLSLQYFSPFGLTLSAPGFSESLPAALDGQRPNTISLGNSGQYWPAGKFTSTGGPVKFTVAAASASWLQSLTGYDGKAYVGELIAVKAGPRKVIPLSQACGKWIDWYEGPQSP